MTQGFIWIRDDWQDYATRSQHALDAFRWDAARERGIIRPMINDPDYCRLFAELGGPVFFTPENGPFGRFPFYTEMGMSSAGDYCERLPFDAINRVQWGGGMERDYQLRLWPWLAMFAVRYRDITSAYDSRHDLTPTETDELLSQVALDAHRISANLNRITIAAYMDRPYSAHHWRKRLTLGAARRNLAPDEYYFSLDKLRESMASLSRRATDARAELDGLDFSLPKHSSNAGLTELTVACSYLWAGVTGRAPSAARTVSKHRDGEESDFVRFVQSIATLTTNNPPTINQVASALSVDWSKFDDVAFANLPPPSVEGQFSSNDIGIRVA